MRKTILFLVLALFVAASTGEDVTNSKAVSPVLSDVAKSISEIISNLNLIIKSRSGTGREKISAEVALAQKEVDKYSKASLLQKPSSGSWFDENLASTREVYDRNILDPAKKKLAEKQKELEAYDLANPVVAPVVAPIKTTDSSKPSSGVDTSHQQMIDMNKSFRERLLKDKEAFYRRQSVLDGTNTEQAKKDQQTANDFEIQALNNKFAIELEAAAKAEVRMKEEHRKEHYLPTPSSNGPIHAEQYRLKTIGSIRDAGISCGHCVGSYAKSTDVWIYRKDDIVAGVRIADKEVFQCYDAGNTVTPASLEFKDELQHLIDTSSIKLESLIEKKAI